MRTVPLSRMKLVERLGKFNVDYRVLVDGLYVIGVGCYSKMHDQLALKVGPREEGLTVGEVVSMLGEDVWVSPHGVEYEMNDDTLVWVEGKGSVATYMVNPGLGEDEVEVEVVRLVCFI